MNIYHMCGFWDSYCQIDYAAWVQAFGSIGAIYWAYIFSNKQSKKQYQIAMEQVEAQHKTAMAQVKAQHDNDRKLREEESREGQIILLTAMQERVNMLGNSVANFIRSADNAEKEKSKLKQHEVNNYVNSFQDCFNDIERLPIYHFKSQKMIRVHTMLRFEIRQIQFITNVYLEPNGFFGIQRCINLIMSMNNVIISLDDFKNQIAEELNALRNG